MATVATAMTGFRSVGRINHHHGQASRLRFVLHELPQLIEGPGMVQCPLCLAHFGPLAYPGQVFQGDSLPRDLCRGDELFTDDVVDRPHMAPLMSRQPFQEAYGPSCAFSLERTSNLEVVGTELLHRRAFVGTPCRIDGNPSATQVNTQHAHGALPSWRWRFDLDVQEEGAIAAFDQRGTGGRLSLEPGFLIVPQGGLKAFAATDQRQAEGPIPFSEAEDALIVVNGGRGKRRVGFGFNLQGGTDTGNGANGEIGGQAEALPHLAVTGVLHLHLVSGMDAACQVGDVVAGVRESNQRRAQRRALGGCWNQFTDHRTYSLHANNVSHIVITHIFG